MTPNDDPGHLLNPVEHLEFMYRGIPSFSSLCLFGQKPLFGARRSTA